MVVSFAVPAKMIAFVANSSLPFEFVSDPGFLTYQAFGLGRTAWKDLFSLGTIARYLKLIARGWLPHKAAAGENLLQLGGDFVLDQDRRLLYAHRSIEPTDRPPVQEIIEAVRAAGRPKPTATHAP